jgi:hypothetical protein
MTAASSPPSFDPATFEGVVMSFERALCAIHGAAFRDQWPRGFGVFMVRIFLEVTAVDGVWDEAKRLSGKDDRSPKDLELVLDVKPGCCRVPKARLLAVFEECGVGVLRRCKTCGKKRLGTPITATNASWSHVCFTCIAHATPYPPGAS